MSKILASKGFELVSSFQRRALMKFIGPFGESIRHINGISNENIVISDYGSGEGYNSAYFFNQTLPKFREYSDRPITIVHNDVPENNWNETFKTLSEASESYIKIPNVYFSGLGRSFDEQIFPDNSVHIGLSFYSFHLLPCPFGAFDHIIVSSSSDFAIKSEAREVANSYFLDLLALRHKELVNAGRLLIVMPTETIGNLFPEIIFQTVHENMHAKGIITDEEKRDVTSPVYGRSDKELRRTLDEVKHLYRVVESKKVEDEWRPTEENREELYEGLKFSTSSHIENMLKMFVERQRVDKVIEEYKKEVERVVMKIPFTSFPSHHLIVLEKIAS